MLAAGKPPGRFFLQQGLGFLACMQGAKSVHKRQYFDKVTPAPSLLYKLTVSLLCQVK